MRVPGGLLLLAVSTLPLACQGTKASEVVVNEPVAARAPSSSGSEALDGPSSMPVEMIEIHASVDNLSDILAGLKQVITLWKTIDPALTESLPADFFPLLQATLIQSGFGPGFLDGLNLEGRFAADVHYPQPHQAHATNDDFELAATLPTKNSKGVINSLPKAFAPQPVGGDVWELRDNGSTLLLKANKHSVDLGRSHADFDRAHALLMRPTNGYAIQLRATNFPKDDLNPSNPLFFPELIEKQLTQVLQGTTAVEASLDFGTGRSLKLMSALEAPIEELGLEYFGEAMTQASTIATLLPDDAAVAIAIPAGAPDQLHQQVDMLAFPQDLLPPPFYTWMNSTLQALHDILNGIQGDLVSAVYTDKKQQMTFVLAGGARDDLQPAVRAFFRAIATGLEQYSSFTKAMSVGLKKYTGITKDDLALHYRVSFKENALTLAGLKSDHFYLTIPSGILEELGPQFAPLVGKKRPRLDVIVLHHEGKTFVAIGKGSKAIMTDIARRIGKTQANNLESAGGLAFARSLDHGCHICIAVDPVESLRLGLIMAGLTPGYDPKTALAGLQEIRELDLDPFALALRLEKGRGSIALGIPEDSIFGAPEPLSTILGVVRSVLSDTEPESTPDPKK